MVPSCDPVQLLMNTHRSHQKTVAWLIWNANYNVVNKQLSDTVFKMDSLTNL